MAFEPMKLIGKRLKRLQLPHFLGLGAQKGGTTSLQKLLEHHQDVFLPHCKEVQYFSQHSDKPITWYAEHYAKAGRKKRRGDITPFYLFHPQAAERIKNLLPTAQMIVLLRDPVERAISQVFHARRHGFENLGIAEALAAEPERLSSGNIYSFQKHSYIARSRYIEQIDRYEKLFKKDQLLILKSEDLFQNTATVWERIQKFLELRPIALPLELPHANAGNGEAETVSPRVREKLREALWDTAEEVKIRYGIDWGWK